MGALLGLAREILLEIIQYVATDESANGWREIDQKNVGDLRSLALSCRSLNDLATPVLYREIVQTHTHGFVCLLRTVLRNPSLALYVREFERHAPENGGENGYSERFETYSDSDWALVRKAMSDILGDDDNGAISEQGIKHEPDGNQDGDEVPILNLDLRVTYLQMGFWDALTALLILQFPNLSKLKLQIFYHASPWLYSLFDRAPQLRQKPQEQILSKVRELHLSWFPGYCGMSLELILPFFQLKYLERIRIEGLSSNDIPFLDARYYSVTSLEIIESNIACTAIGPILACFPNIRNFVYEYSSTINTEFSFLPQYFGNALRRLSGVLEEVKINVVNYASNNPTLERPEALGDLSRMKKLRVLSANWLSLWSFLEWGSFDRIEGNSQIQPEGIPFTREIPTDWFLKLPESLQSFEIFDCPWDFLANVRHLVAFKQASRLPDLKTITLWIYDLIYENLDFQEQVKERTHDMEDMVKPVRDMCTEAGIQLNFRVPRVKERKLSMWSLASDADNWL